MFFLVRLTGWVVVCISCYLFSREPDTIYLTWVDDPTTTMTIVWQGGDQRRLQVHRLGESKWRSITAGSHFISQTSIAVFTAHLQRLQPDTLYVFKVEGSEKEYRFRTLPRKLSRDVRFVVGGDIFYPGKTALFEKMNRVICSDDPDFVVLGGDLAYTTGSKRSSKGHAWEVKRWQEFLQRLQKTLQTPDGRLIPLMPVVGNHEVHSKAESSQNPELFYEIFPFPVEGEAYRVMRAGNYLHFVFLDSGHTCPIDGKQTAWLKNQLKRCDPSYLFAAYHIGAYPSVYKYKGHIPELLRTSWVPLFEAASVNAAFEHHSHALKRTYPIRNHQRDPSGVIYLGDGSWGVSPRSVYTPKEQWYLEKVASVNACWFIHLSPTHAQIEARTPEGEVVDRLTLPSRLISHATDSALTRKRTDSHLPLLLKAQG